MKDHIERKQPETLRLRELMPSLTVNDIGASVAWYQDILGCVVADRMEHEGRLMGAVLNAGDIQILLSQDDGAKGSDREKGVGFRLYGVTAQDVDQLAADVKARGGELAHEPKDQPWKARDFAITDPDGYKISISAGIGD
ncbi:MAG: VOC family protein [Acidobacteriota bacterium]|nr:VOC family protein [Acidobacteriota bacterium]